MNRPFIKYASSDSVVFLDGAASSFSMSARGKRLSDDSDDRTVIAPPLAVAVSIRRGRLLLITTTVVITIVAIILVIHRGIDVTQFPANAKNDTARKALLDDYNSYSGNVASTVGKPIEMFVAVLAQLVSLRFMAHAYTQTTIPKRQIAIRLALSAAIGYLINNGFNAINVQLHEANVHAVILASDLAVSGTLSASASAETSPMAKTISEKTHRNSISNTVLHNAVLPRVPLNQSLCDWEQNRLENSGDESIPLPTVDYGFTQRDWQSRLLQEALPAKGLALVVNPTNVNVNDGVKADDLPMKASIAADLLLYMLSVSPNVFPWGKYSDFMDHQDLVERYPMAKNVTSPAIDERTAIITGLLPKSNTSSEIEQRAWFLDKAMASVNRQFNKSLHTLKRDINLEFSHVEITPSIQFDAVTLEATMDPTYLATASSPDNETQYTQVRQAAPAGVASDCGPWPALCLVYKKEYRAKTSAFFVDANQQVHAFSTCATKYGDELMSRGYNSIFSCDTTSNSSFMIMSVGKRLEADSLVQNRSDDNTESTGTARITNLRKIYTIVIGRLSWKLEDLAKVFGADCGSNVTSHNCLGLHVPLETSTLSELGQKPNEDAKQQTLVVSAEGLPNGLILPSARLFDYRPRAVPLVEVSESPNNTVLNADILLRHNIKQVNWSTETVTVSCDSDIERLMYDNLNNHLYIEHGFQVAYTAATFFLLQNAVVKDTIPIHPGSAATTLTFDGNTRDVLATVSTPYQNALLTFVGCGLLLLCVLITVLKSSVCHGNGQDPLAEISRPQAVARVMLDDSQYPSLLLHRRVLHSQTDGMPAIPPYALEEFVITQIAVEHEQHGIAYRTATDAAASSERDV